MSRSQAANSGIHGMNPLRNPQFNRNPVGIPRPGFDYHPQSYRYQNGNGGGGGPQETYARKSKSKLSWDVSKQWDDAAESS
uniref:Uncharacterized protein n=1 Tax=Tanacetum cinerariifolium TaxID=118510 RepID=A0A699IKU9_TANCI|nr:hypothetical protein [Tanacetum cinerariifolium]